jgi:hypothetical protein
MLVRLPLLLQLPSVCLKTVHASSKCATSVADVGAPLQGAFTVSFRMALNSFYPPLNSFTSHSMGFYNLFQKGMTPVAWHSSTQHM